MMRHSVVFAVRRSLIILLGILPVFPLLTRYIPVEYTALWYLPAMVGWYFFKPMWPVLKRNIFNVLLCLLGFLIVFANIILTKHYIDLIYFGAYATAVTGYYLLLHSTVSASLPHKKIDSRKQSAASLNLFNRFDYVGPIFFTTLTLSLLGFYVRYSFELYYDGEISIASGAFVVSRFDFILYFTMMGFYAAYRLYRCFLRNPPVFLYAISLGLYFLACVGIWIFLNYFYIAAILFFLCVPCFKCSRDMNVKHAHFALMNILTVLAAFLVTLADSPTRKKFFYFDTPLHSVELRLAYDTLTPGKISPIEYRIMNNGVAPIDGDSKIHVNFSDEHDGSGIQTSTAFTLDVPPIARSGQEVIVRDTYIPYWLKNKPGMTQRFFLTGRGYLEHYHLRSAYYPLRIKKFEYLQDFSLSKFESLHRSRQKAISVDQSSKVKKLNRHFSVPFNRFVDLPVLGSGIFNPKFGRSINLSNYFVVPAKLGIYTGGFLFIIMLILFRKLLVFRHAQLGLRETIATRCVLFVFLLGVKYNIPFSLTGIVFLLVLAQFMEHEPS